MPFDGPAAAPGLERANRRRAACRSASSAAAALCIALLCVLCTARADPVNISRAETLLFMTPHLKDVRPPSRLHYAFHKSGTLEEGFSDTVDIDITAQTDGGKKSTVRFFSGARQVNYPDIEHVEENPVLLFYLEREIREMSRLTGGKPNYFRHRIRAALADSAQIKDIDIRMGDRTVRAQQITISPYESDPDRGRYERLANKSYVFTICETIPGVVYEMRGVVPAASGSPGDQAVIDETMTFKSAGAPR
ncbi:MAG TPA: hypothetical protein VH183_15085 [Burkholderiaceae bacterium]|jgi:hypothetical protein|nr:hypothetical protein [Burkholderiaceae bacterium]